jgi:CheY-like chemotaxis protein
VSSSIAEEARRILVVDDNPAIHEDFRKILVGPAVEGAAALASSEAALFGMVSDTPSARALFRIDSAFQGEEGLARVRAALEKHEPYAMAFIDMRMPLGWDGIETMARIWEHDPAMQIVLCTAYSDYSWEEILARSDARIGSSS